MRVSINKMNVVIRLATVEEILNLRHKILRKGFPIEEVMFEEDPWESTRNYAIFRDDGYNIACLSLLRADWFGRETWRLRAMAVDEEYQNQGFGSMLMDFMFKDLKKNNLIDDIWLHARTTSEAFYKRYGFITVSDVFGFGNAGLSVKMLKKHTNESCDITIPDLVDLKQCYELEKQYCLKLEDEVDVSNGFFLPGTKFECYEEMFNTGFFRVIKECDIVAAYVIVIPPGHHYIKKLLADNTISFFEDIYDYKKTYWIQKVAVHPHFKKKGYASKLYSKIDDEFGEYYGLTATAISPYRNIASENLHKGFGMERCGISVWKKIGTIYVNTVWGKRPLR